MKIKDLHNNFKTGSHEYVIEPSTDYDFVVSVFDSGRMKVGEFFVDCDYEDMDLDYFDSDDFPDTLERIRKRGDDSEVAQKIIHFIKK